jgi:hypothetical protein
MFNSWVHQIRPAKRFGRRASKAVFRAVDYAIDLD